MKTDRVFRAAVAATTVAMLGATGCQSYRAEPLDLEGYRAGLELARIDPVPIREYARSLGGAERGIAEAFDLRDGVTLAEGEVLALFLNPSLRVARSEAGVAQAVAEHAERWEDPVFGFDGTELLSPGGPFEFGLTLELTIPISGRLGVESEQRGLEYELELLRLERAEWAVRMRCREGWVSWSAARRELELLNETIEQVGRIEAIADRWIESGDLARVGGRTLLLARLDLEMERDELAVRVLDEKRKLEALMGLPPSAGVELIPALLSTPDGNATREAIERRALSDGFAVRLAEREYLVAEKALELAVREQYPDISVLGGYGSEDRDDRLLLGFSLPIPILNGNRGAIAVATVQRTAARAHAEGVVLGVLHEVADAYAAIDGVRRRMRTVDERVSPLADEQVLEVQRLAELGEIDLFLMLDALQRQAEVKRRLIVMRSELSQLRIRLDEIAGPVRVDQGAVGQDVDTKEQHGREGADS